MGAGAVAPPDVMILVVRKPEVQAVIAQLKEMRGADPRRHRKAVWFQGTSWGAGDTCMELGLECADFVGATQIGVEEALSH